MVLSKIDYWEERATEWSGKPDRIRVKVGVYDVATGQPIDAVEIVGTNRWGTL